MNDSTIKALVRQRDGFRCVDCRMTESLHVHRVEPGSEYSMSGCITLCRKCHGKRHRGAMAGRNLGQNPEYKLRRSKLLTEMLCLRISENLKQEIGKAADAAGLPMNEYIAQVMAKHLKKPRLGIIPRKPGGRPRSEVVLNGAH